MITVVVADDQELVRTGFALILGSDPGVEVVAQAADGSQAVAAAHRFRPDVVLMDIRMPVLDGIEATQQITSDPQLTGVRVLVVTTFDGDEYVVEDEQPVPGGRHAPAGGADPGREGDSRR